MRPNGPSRAAIVLIAAGVILFLSNLGMIPYISVRAYWPLAMSAWGVAMLSNSRGGWACQVWPWTMVVYGGLWTLINLGYLHMRPGQLWPIFLIAAGVSLLVRRSPCAPNRAFFGEAPKTWHGGNGLYENAVFSGVKRRIDLANFEGADLNASFGEVKVDLRGATIPEGGQAIIDTNVSFGGIKLRVPETWKVVVQANAVFGAYEDKTVPPRPAAGVIPPQLIIRGNATFGAVEIEN